MSMAFVPPHLRGKGNPSGPPNQTSIQKMLDENNQLIQAIIDYQNKGKVQEVVQYQQILHRNLVYLATIADSNQNMQSLLPAPSNQNQSGQMGSQMGNMNNQVGNQMNMSSAMGNQINNPSPNQMGNMNNQSSGNQMMNTQGPPNQMGPSQNLNNSAPSQMGPPPVNSQIAGQGGLALSKLMQLRPQVSMAPGSSSNPMVPGKPERAAITQSGPMSMSSQNQPGYNNPTMSSSGPMGGQMGYPRGPMPPQQTMGQGMNPQSNNLNTPTQGTYSQQQQPMMTQQQPMMSQQQPPMMAQQQSMMSQQQPMMSQQQPILTQQQPMMPQQQPIGMSSQAGTSQGNPHGPMPPPSGPFRRSPNQGGQYQNQQPQNFNQAQYSQQPYNQGQNFPQQPNYGNQGNPQGQFANYPNNQGQGQQQFNPMYQQQQQQRPMGETPMNPPMGSQMRPQLPPSQAAPGAQMPGQPNTSQASGYGNYAPNQSQF